MPCGPLLLRRWAFSILVFEQVAEIRDGDRLEIDPIRGAIANLTTGKEYTCSALPANIMELVQDGGLIPHLKKQK